VEVVEEELTPVQVNVLVYQEALVVEELMVHQKEQVMLDVFQFQKVFPEVMEHVLVLLTVVVAVVEQLLKVLMDLVVVALPVVMDHQTILQEQQ
jgi:hypothetical protein